MHARLLVVALAAPLAGCSLLLVEPGFADGTDGGMDADVSTDGALNDGMAPGCAVPDRDSDDHDAEECGGDDCDDGDATRSPGNAEVCDPDHHDEDCDPTTNGGADGDSDGFETAACCNEDICGADCDDGRREVHPDAIEQCNNVDDDCDGTVDEPGAFCPTGICTEHRCRASNWEWVYESDAFDDVEFGMDVDSHGNVYVGVHLGGSGGGSGGDLNGDGVPEPPGDYLVSVAPEGFPRWFAALPEAILLGTISMSADESTVAVPGLRDLRFYSSADGSLVGTATISLFGRWDGVRIRDVARVGDELVVAARLTSPSGTAILLARYDAARTEVGRRVVEVPGSSVDVVDVAGSRSYLALVGQNTAPIDIGTGELASGQFLSVLEGDLSTRWAIESDGVVRVAVSDQGHAAGVGGFGYGGAPPWSPPWTTTSYPAPGGFAASFDSDGAHLWTRAHSGTYTGFGGVAYDGRDNILVSGTFSGTMAVAPLGTLGPAIGVADAFVGLFGVRDGFARYTRHLAGSEEEAVWYASVDPYGGLLVFGDFTGTITLPSGTTYPSLFGQALFLVRISDL